AIDCTDGVLDIWVNDSGGTWTNVIDFNNTGASLAGQLSITSATNNYLRITGNGAYEAMTRYKNNFANYWYTGIRTSAGIASTLDYHVYSTALGDDAFTSGDFVAKRNLNTKTGAIQINGTTVINSSRAFSNVASLTLDSSGTSSTLNYGTNGSRTFYKNNAGASASQSGFFETASPTNYYSGASSWQHLMEARHHNNDNNYAMQIAGSFFNQDFYGRKTNNQII
ncbi:MAG: hypothetical protein VW625_10585, partial [Perlucidibaca sp.]